MTADPIDAEPFEPDPRRSEPSSEDRKAVAKVIGGLSLFLGVIADVGTHVIAATQREGEDADIPGAVEDALECRGDAADEIRAGLWGLSVLVAELAADLIEDDGAKPAPAKKKKPEKRKRAA